MTPEEFLVGDVTESRYNGLIVPEISAFNQKLFIILI